ncbi:MAG: YlxR family protein [Lachnospiraceae bacterium]|nr:YlxR family protein [Lachnospiraceae bacterium]
MSEHIANRTCVGCRQVFDKSRMLRVVKEKNGTVKIDADKKTMGRGAYICRNTACIEEAKKKNSLGRALRTRIDPAVYLELSEVVYGK